MSPNIITAAAQAAAVSRIMPGATIFITVSVSIPTEPWRKSYIHTESSTTLEAAIEEVASVLRCGMQYRGTLLVDPIHGGTWLDLAAEAIRSNELAERDDEEADVEYAAMAERIRDTVQEMAAMHGEI